MKFNKILLVSLLLLILSIGAVAAADNTDAVSIDDAAVLHILADDGTDTGDDGTDTGDDGTDTGDDGNDTDSIIGTNLTSETTQKYYKNATQYVVKLVDANGNPLANQNISFLFSNKTYNRITNDEGLAGLNINLNPGVYEITASFNGTEAYNASSVKLNFTVMAPIVTSDVRMYYQNGTRFYATLIANNTSEPIAGAILNFTIGKSTYSRTTNENGSASLAINLKPGTYNVTTKANGFTVKNTITVLAPISTSALVMNYKDGSRFKATVFDKSPNNTVANATVKFTINSKSYTRTTNENGSASLAINLKPGLYYINTTYNGFSVRNIILVRTTIDTSDLQMYYKNGSSFVAKVYNKSRSILANETVNFTIGSNTYSRTTNENGTASLAINLKPGTYKITTSATDLTVTNTITVLSPIVVNNTSTTYKSKFTYDVKIVDNGNPVANQSFSVVFNKVTYKGTTDENGTGKVTVNPSTLKPGSYGIVTKYSNSLGSFSETKNVTINKASASLSVLTPTVTLKYNSTYKTYIGQIKVKATYQDKAVSGAYLVLSFNWGQNWYRSDVKTNSNGIAYWTVDTKFIGNNGTLMTVYNNTYFGSTSMLYTTITIKK